MQKNRFRKKDLGPYFQRRCDQYINPHSLGQCVQQNLISAEYFSIFRRKSLVYYINKYTNKCNIGLNQKAVKLFYPQHQLKIIGSFNKYIQKHNINSGILSQVKVPAGST